MINVSSNRINRLRWMFPILIGSICLGIYFNAQRKAAAFAPPRFTKEFLSMLEVSALGFTVVSDSALRLTLSPFSEEFQYVVSIRSLHQFLTEYPQDRSGRRKLMLRYAKGLEATARYLKAFPPLDPSAEAIPLDEVITHLRDSWRNEVVVSYRGESRGWNLEDGLKSPHFPEGWAKYNTVAAIHRRGRFLSRYTPMVQNATSRNDKQFPRFVVSSFDGEDWFRTERGTHEGSPTPGGKAEVGSKRTISDLYHENGLAGFAAWYPATFSGSLRDLLEVPGSIKKTNYNVWAEKLSDGTVRLIFLGGIIGEGIERSEMIFDPSLRWALRSGRAMVGVEEAGDAALSYQVECSDFHDLGAIAGTVPRRIRFEFSDSFVIEHRLSEFEVRADSSVETFRPALGTDWEITHTSL